MVLARLDGKTLPPPTVPRLQSALAWFPADATLVAAVDLRRMAGGVGGWPSGADVLKQMPAQTQHRLFAAIERAGNVRIDRVAVAFTEDKDPAKTKVFVRITGTGNAEWIRAAIRYLEPGYEEKEYRDRASGKTIAVLRASDRPPVVLFVEKTEILLVGYAREGAHEDLVEEVLAVRAGKQPSVLAGPLKSRLRKVPASAAACLVGEVPAHLRKKRGPMSQMMPLPVPVQIDAFVERTPAGYDVRVAAGMMNAEEAHGAVTQIGKMRKEGLDNLQQLLKQPQADPQLPVHALINLLQSVQMQSQGSELRLRALVPRDALHGLPAWLMQE